MKFRLTVVFFSIFLLLPAMAAAKKKKAETPIGWGYAANEAFEIRPSFLHKDKPIVKLGKGALVSILEEKLNKSKPSLKVRAINPATFEPVTGWVDSSLIERQPLDAYPEDQDLLKQLGGDYLQDFTASYAEIVRFLLKQGDQPPALVCFIGARILPTSRLQIFIKDRGNFGPGPYLDFPSSEMNFAITDFEVRDLMGDGKECLITHEPFSIQPENGGVNLVIRRMEMNQLMTLWKAPIEYRNTASYLPQLKILSPPEENIGVPGTVTAGEVNYIRRGGVSEPAWKGKVEFLIIGREKPVDSVKIEKTCNWDGTRFEPLK